MRVSPSIQGLEHTPARLHIEKGFFFFFSFCNVAHLFQRHVGFVSVLRNGSVDVLAVVMDFTMQYSDRPRAVPSDHR